MHAPDPPLAPSPSPRATPALALAVGVVTVAVFALSLGGSFVQWDDDRNFTGNPHYRGLGWAQLRWMFSTTLTGHWIPLTWMSLGLDYALWGMNPVGYHVTNVVLHAVNAALFFVLALRLLRLALPSAGDGALRTGAAGAALFFAVHPLRVESVAWITERRDVLSGLFYLLTLIAYVQMCGSSGGLRRRWRLLSLVAFAMALLSKSIVMSLPLVLIVLDIYPLRRLPGRWRQWMTPESRAVLREKLPYAVMALAGAILAAVVVSRTLGMTSMTAYPMQARLAMAAYALVFYLRKTIVPAALSPLYELPARIELLDLHFLGSAVAAVLITVALIAARRHWPAGLAAWAVYALTLAPVLGLVHNGPQLVADRYSYLACLAWALLLGGAVMRLVEARAPDGRPRASARVALAAVAIWVAVLATLTWNQTRVWADTDAIWRQALEVDPDCARCHHEWGALLGNRGELERAIVHFRRSVELRPDRVRTHGSVGLALLKAGRPAEAAVHFTRVLQDNPGDADVRSRLGAALIQQGRLTEARVELERAVRDNPRHPDALTNLGLALLYLGHPTEARPYLERASSLAPASALPHVGLARAFLALGDGDAAARHAATARHLDPGLAAHMLPPP